jgi:hypothetical protein
MAILDPNGPLTFAAYPGKHWRTLDVRSDLDRIERQQSFIRKLAGVAIERSLANPFVGIEAADTALKYVKADTGLGRGDVNALVRAFRTVNVNDSTAIQFETLPVLPDPDNPNVTLVPAPDDVTVLQQLRTFGDDTPAPPAVAPGDVHVTVLDGTGTSDTAGTAKALAAQGFVVISTGRATRDAAVTQVRYGNGSAEAAKTLLDYLPDAELVPDKALDGAARVDLVLGRSFSTIYVVPTTTTTVPPPGVPTTAPTTTTLPPVPSTTLPPDRCPN